MYGKQGMIGHQERVGPPLDHSRKGPLEVRRRSSLHTQKLYAQRVGFPCNVAGHVGQVTRYRINEDCDTGDRRDRLFQQLEALPQQLAIPQFQPSKIAIGPRQAGDEPSSTRSAPVTPTTMGTAVVTCLIVRAASIE